MGIRVLRGWSGVSVITIAVISVVLAGGTASWIQAQTLSRRPWASNVVVPQCRQRSTIVRLEQALVRVAIVEQVATTTLDLVVLNPSQSQEMAELVIPVPDGAVVRGLDFEGKSDEPTAVLLSQEEARGTFEDMVRKLRDPALLEFAGWNLIRTSVFPVAAEAKQTVRVIYEHVMPSEGDRVDYVLPRSGLVSYDVPWDIQVQLQAERGIAAVYSPTHPLETSPVGQRVSAKLTAAGQRQPGAFHLSFLRRRAEATASLFTYPDPTSDGGYFLLLAGVQSGNSSASEQASATTVRRELTLVLDRSGSMNGEKLEQAQEAALQILAGMEANEYFNIIAYNSEVARFEDQPVRNSRENRARAEGFIRELTAKGGTNIHDALLEALRPPAQEETLPIVLFLTDGRPTVGQTSEQAIRQVASQGNAAHRRIFTFGVGVDVNTPLLDRIARETRAFATFVLPGEDVEVRVARVFRGLDGPTLAAPQLQVLDEQGEPVARLHDVVPEVLGDLFRGDQLVVMGKYRGQEQLRFALAGDRAGKKKTFRFDFAPEKAATANNAFVARLWASRQIALLTDRIRDMGVQDNAEKLAANDPHLRELVDEIVRLSTQFGVLTEYTAFLAQEGSDLGNYEFVLEQASKNFFERAVNCRWGVASANQDINNPRLRNQAHLNVRNEFLDANLKPVAISNVQQCNDSAYYRRNGQWVTAALLENTDVSADREVEFGSDEFLKLVRDLATAGRQNMIALDGNILIQWNGETILIKGPTDQVANADQK